MSKTTESDIERNQKKAQMLRIWAYTPPSAQFWPKTTRKRSLPIMVRTRNGNIPRATRYSKVFSTNEARFPSCLASAARWEKTLAMLAPINPMGKRNKRVQRAYSPATAVEKKAERKKVGS